MTQFLGLANWTKMYCNIVGRGKGEGEGDFSCNLQEGPLCSFVKLSHVKIFGLFTYRK